MDNTFRCSICEKSMRQARKLSFSSYRMLSIWIATGLLLLLTNIYVAAQKNGEATTTPDLVDPRVSTALQLISNGRADEAAVILEAASAEKSNDPALMFWLGKAYYRQAKYQKAIEKLNLSTARLDKTKIEYKEAVQILGFSHYVLGHLAESIPYFEQIIKWQPENNEVSYALGVSYIQSRQPAKSRDVFALMFSVPANSASAYLINAQMHVRQRFEETAEAELNQALKLDMKLPQVNLVLGELAIYKAEIDKGIVYLQKEIALNPLNGMAYYRLGEALTRQSKWDEAIPPLQKSIWLNPFFSGPYIVLGKVHLKKGDFGNAENILRRSVAMDPNNFGAHHLLAQTLQQAGKIDEAKREFTLAEKLRGNVEKDP